VYLLRTVLLIVIETGRLRCVLTQRRVFRTRYNYANHQTRWLPGSPSSGRTRNDYHVRRLSRAGLHAIYIYIYIYYGCGELNGVTLLIIQSSSYACHVTSLARTSPNRGQIENSHCRQTIPLQAPPPVKYIDATTRNKRVATDDGSYVRRRVSYGWSLPGDARHSLRL